MGVIDTVKEVGSLIQKLDNMELLKRMVELQEQVYALVGENRDLKDTNRTLQGQLDAREQMTFRNNAYWKGEDGPFCPQCFDVNRLAVRMLVSKGYYPKCPKCKTVAVYPDDDMSPLTIIG